MTWILSTVGEASRRPALGVSSIPHQPHAPRTPPPRPPTERRPRRRPPQRPKRNARWFSCIRGHSRCEICVRRGVIRLGGASEPPTVVTLARCATCDCPGRAVQPSISASLFCRRSETKVGTVDSSFILFLPSADRAGGTPACYSAPVI